jgi:hypothetical protein
LSCCRTSVSLLAPSIPADRPAQSSHQECPVLETQREDRCGAQSRRKAILPRDARRSREFDGGTGTMVKSQLSRICLYKRSSLQSQILSAAGRHFINLYICGIVHCAGCWSFDACDRPVATASRHSGSTLASRQPLGVEMSRTIAAPRFRGAKRSSPTMRAGRGKFDRGTETMINSQLSRICFCIRSVLQGQWLSSQLVDTLT